MRPGEDLESLTETIFRMLTSTLPDASVERDVQMDGVDGPRQIDVLVRSSVGPVEILTIIECKDSSRKVDVSKVDSLHSVMQDVRASTGVLVTRGGFSRTSVRKAERLGISLLRADALSNLKNAAQQVPVHIRAVRQTGFQVDGEIFLETGVSLDRSALTRLNDTDLAAELRADLLRDPTLVSRLSGRHIWEPTKLSAPWFVRDTEGRAWEFRALEISYRLVEQHYFGYLHELQTVLFLQDEIKRESTLLIPAEALTFEYVQRFAQFDSREQLPVEPALSVSVVALPDPGELVAGAMNVRPLSG